jgi:hypothetical protein
MSDDLKIDLGQLDQAADSLIAALSSQLCEEGNRVNIDLAVMAAGALAGLTILRSSPHFAAVQFNTAAPPHMESIFSPDIDHRGSALFAAMREFCPRLGLDSQLMSSAPGLSDPEDVDFIKTILRLESDLEPVFLAVADESGVDPQLRAHLAAYAALKLVKMGESIVPVEIGMARALKAVVYAAKTHPLSSLG